jgi:transcriptional regulator with XRE-family HTH domain
VQKVRQTCQHYLQEGLEICQNRKHPPGRNLISQRLIELRRQHNMSQRLLAYQLQLNGYDMDKNVITRIETNKRYVTDVELKALTEIFHVSYEYLIEGKEEKS